MLPDLSLHAHLFFGSLAIARRYISTRMYLPLGRTTKVAGMPLSKSTAHLSYVHSSEELASAAATAAAKSRFHPAHHPSGLPVHP